MHSLASQRRKHPSNIISDERISDRFLASSETTMLILCFEGLFSLLVAFCAAVTLFVKPSLNPMSTRRLALERTDMCKKNDA
jgi:hypothetical protein